MQQDNQPLPAMSLSDGSEVTLEDLLIGRKPRYCTTAGNNAVVHAVLTEEEMIEDGSSRAAELGLSKLPILAIDYSRSNGPYAQLRCDCGKLFWRRIRLLRISRSVKCSKKCHYAKKAS